MRLRNSEEQILNARCKSTGKHGTCPQMLVIGSLGISSLLSKPFSVCTHRADTLSDYLEHVAPLADKYPSRIPRSDHFSLWQIATIEVAGGPSSMLSAALQGVRISQKHFLAQYP